MFSIGFFEILLVLVLALFLLKPEQWANTAKLFGRLLFKVRSYTSELEQHYINQEKELELQKRIENAAKVSDVSDLMTKTQSDEQK